MKAAQSYAQRPSLLQALITPLAECWHELHMQVSIAKTAFFEAVITTGDTHAIFTCTHHGTCGRGLRVTISDHILCFGYSYGQAFER